MSKSKKTVLFIVEGITDEVSLALGFSELMNSDEVRFAITRGDVTTKPMIRVDNIANEITRIIRTFMGRIYKKSDILKVIHIVDTDGCFINDENVIYGDTDIVYNDDTIVCRNPDGIRARNVKKSEILRRMAGLKKVYKDLDYSVYYMSCNLDHVLHDDANISLDDKNDKADKFRDLYADDLKGFVDFFRQPEIAAEGGYSESWDFIQKEQNSLKRHTNINILIDQEIEERGISFSQE